MKRSVSYIGNEYVTYNNGEQWYCRFYREGSYVDRWDCRSFYRDGGYVERRASTDHYWMLNHLLRKQIADEQLRAKWLSVAAIFGHDRISTRQAEQLESMLGQDK